MPLEWTMLSMVNANRFINTVVIPLVIVAYGVFLLIDHNNQVNGRDHIQSIQKIGSIDGLVFGGSNAMYGLSAEFLSYYTGIKWHNASVLAELGTIQQHKSFIEALSARIDRTKVRYVVYSTIAPNQTGVIARSQSSTNLGITIKPKISALGYIRHQPFSDSGFRYYKRNIFGDMVFENEACDFTAVAKHEREDEDISTDFLVDYTIFFASLFPNASILIVVPSALPSAYYGALSFDDSRFEENLRTKFYNVLKRKYFKNTNVKIIFQPPYSSVTQVCDTEGGRLWRTRNLIEFIR
jgi:hypothetical protein